MDSMLRTVHEGVSHDRGTRLLPDDQPDQLWGLIYVGYELASEVP